MKFDYDHRHKVVEGKELSPGDRVWIPDLKAEGTVIKQHKVKFSKLLLGEILLKVDKNAVVT